MPEARTRRSKSGLKAQDLNAFDPTQQIKQQGLQDPDQPLSEKQRLFVNFHVHEKMTPTAAARAAGYNHKDCGNIVHYLKKNPRIQQAIAVEREEYAKASQITKKKVIDGMLEAVEMARIKAEPITMIAGWREIGKMCGLYEATKTKVEVSVHGRVVLDQVNSMSDEELLALVEERGDGAILEGDFREVPNE